MMTDACVVRYVRMDELTELGVVVHTTCFSVPGLGGQASLAVLTLPLQPTGNDPFYTRIYDPSLTDEDLDGRHQRVIDRLRSGDIALEGAPRLHASTIPDLLTAFVREQLRALAPDDVAALVEDVHTAARNRHAFAEARQRGETAAMADAASTPISWDTRRAVTREIRTEMLDTFDLDTEDEAESDLLLDIIYETVDTWVDEQVAHADGLDRPALSHREREAFVYGMIKEDLEQAPPGTVVGDVMPHVMAQVAHLEALRSRVERN